MKKFGIYILLFAVALLAACSTDSPVGGVNGGEPLAPTEGNIVLFSAGNLGNASRATIPYLGKGGRFVCRMYHIGAIGGTTFDTYTTAWLKVNNDYGNSVYRSHLFDADEYDSNLFDDFGFEKMSTIFYWQNRRNHAFIAFTDLHRTFDNDYVGGTAEGTLKMDDSAADYVLIDEDAQYRANKFDLHTTTKYATYEKQPDPALADTVMLPAGATQEANRVELIFRHCFSQIQVNLKKSADGGIVNLSAADILKVELLGVSEEGYVFYEANPSTGKPHPTAYKPVEQRDYTEEELRKNQYGTAMEMYDMGEENYQPGYLKSFRAIAFGQLRAIRLYWREHDNPDVVHEVTYTVKIVDGNDYINLRSGVKYVHNLELRRGTLAVIKTVILPWEIDETRNSTSGVVDEE